MPQENTENKYKLVAVKELRDTENFKRAIAVIYYENGEKVIDIVEEPTIKFHATKIDKIEKWKGKNIVVIPEEDTEVCECPVSEIYDAIVDLEADFDPEHAERDRRYLEACRKNKKSPQNLLLLNHVHGIDVDLTDHYIGRFMTEHNLTESTEDLAIKLNKCYFDIETDNLKERRFISGEEAITPVNAISFFDSRTSTLIIRLLDNCEDSVQYNPQIEEFKAHLEEHRVRLENKWNEMQEKMFEGSNLPRINVKIIFYKSELEELKAHYRDMNEVYHPDYLIAFNHGFDHTFLINRLIYHVGDAHKDDIISSDLFPINYRRCFYESDQSAKEVSKRNDKYSFTTEYSVLDAQYDYFKIRESMKKPEEYNLDYVLHTVLGDTGKTEHEGIEMYEFPYADYALFVEYSGQDTLGMRWADIKTNDSDTMIMLGNLSHTRPEKCLTKTIMLRNFIEYFFLENSHLVLSNNRTKILNKISANMRSEGKFYDPEPELQPYKNIIDKITDLINNEESNIFDIDDEEEESTDFTNESQIDKTEKKTKFRGAFCSDPNLLCDIGKMIMGVRSHLIFDYNIDSDLSSLYPNLKIAWNLFVTTLVGKIYPKSNVLDINYSANLADYIMSRNDIEIGHKYFNLPSHEEFIELFKQW